MFTFYRAHFVLKAAINFIEQSKCDGVKEIISIVVFNFSHVFLPRFVFCARNFLFVPNLNRDLRTKWIWNVNVRRSLHFAENLNNSSINSSAATESLIKICH